MNEMTFEPKVKMDIDGLKSEIPLFAYHSAVNGGVEDTNVGFYMNKFEKGSYNCVLCHENVFSSAHKYKSDLGHAAFYKPSGNVIEVQRDKGGFTDLEIKCENCGAHLGKIVDDGPKEHGGKRYRINSSSLSFEPAYDVRLNKF